jgi:hypothetical protein
MVVDTTINKVSLDELKTRLEYQCLLPAQKKYVESLLQSGEATGAYNFIAAAAIAYPGSARKPRSLAVRSSQMQAHKNVRRCLDLAFGRLPEDPVLEDLRRAIRKSIRRDGGLLSDNTLTAIRFYEKYAGKKLVTHV